ncbi:30112_t:CDS:2 [Racocetra persica]|uniref:30112_t:CDS:1 n=1 Tax=Racocetra persica TaxID=160502 RepID=A0ACA9KKN6_9GLOM|nr:30112_t:CDS:2 [Racocetra persica]
MSAINKEPESTTLNDSVTPDLTQISLESNLNRLSVEALKFVCCGMGLSETGQKQEIVSSDRAQCPVLEENSLDAYSKQDAVDQDFSPNKALASGDMSYIRIARQIAMERAYIVRVTDENSWELAAKMVNVDRLDLMTELFKSKHESVRSALAANTNLANGWNLYSANSSDAVVYPTNRFSAYSTNGSGAVVCPINGFSATVLGCTKSRGQQGVPGVISSLLTQLQSFHPAHSGLEGSIEAKNIEGIAPDRRIVNYTQESLKKALVELEVHIRGWKRGFLCSQKALCVW